MEEIKGHNMPRQAQAILLLLALVLPLLSAHRVEAATRCVNPGGTGGCFATIQTAVDAASAGDTITVAAGTYAENISIATPGTLPVAPLTISGTAGATLIDGGQSGSVFSVSKDVYLNLAGVTIANGMSSSGPGINGRGGGIFNDGGTLQIANSAIMNSTASNGYGGGIYTHNGSVTLTNSLLSANRATNGPGGGIYSDSGTVTLNATTLDGNVSGLSGGGIHATGGVLMLIDSTVSNNTTGASGGGGIYSASAATITLTRSTLYGNVTNRGYGGAIYAGTGGTLRITNSTISANSAPNGGDLGVYTGAGGIFNGGSATLTYSTVAGNSAATYGGGLFNAGSIFTVTTSIVAENSAPQNPDVLGPFTSGGHNLIGNPTGASGFTGTGDMLNVAAHLGPLANNGGLTLTRALLPGSPAIDGLPAIWAICQGTDQRGVARPQGAGCDIGAYEVPLAAVPASRPGPSLPPPAPPHAPIPRPSDGGTAGSPVPVPTGR